MENKRHFSEFLQAEEKIASNVLTDKLNKLEREGMLSKRSDPDYKQKIIYSLTAKSIDLLPLIAEAIRWSIKYEPVDEVKHQPSIELLSGFPKTTEIFREQLIAEHINRKTTDSQ